MKIEELTQRLFNFQALLKRNRVMSSTSKVAFPFLVIFEAGNFPKGMNIGLSYNKQKLSVKCPNQLSTVGDFDLASLISLLPDCGV